MLKWLNILAGTLRSALRCQQALEAENLALRQQLAVLKHGHPRPRLSETDRLFWVLLSKIWSGWRTSLHVVQPETVPRWHRRGFRYYWRWKSRRQGRPKIDPEILDLIRCMCRANPLWGAPRIHGELLKLGIDVSEATVKNSIGRLRFSKSTKLARHHEHLGRIRTLNESLARSGGSAWVTSSYWVSVISGGSLSAT